MSTTSTAVGLMADVTFVVIAYNERLHIAECIREILAQRTTAQFEVILVDDGSTDGTAQVAINAAAGDVRLRVVPMATNQGRGAARAAGVQAARGRAIAFVDADITLPADWLQRCIAELPGHAAVGGVAVPDGDSTVVARISQARPRTVAGSMPITGNNVLFDRRVLDQIEFDPQDRLGEDFRLAKRLVAAGFSLNRVPGLTVHHEEGKSYADAIRWRIANGVDAASHAREWGRLRFADLVFLGWVGAWIAGIVAAVFVSPWWLLLGPVSGAGAGVAHAITRFRPIPVRQFLVACLLDVPLLTAYLLGRTIAFPRMLRGRSPSAKAG